MKPKGTKLLRWAGRIALNEHHHHDRNVEVVQVAASKEPNRFLIPRGIHDAHIAPATIDA